MSKRKFLNSAVALLAISLSGGEALADANKHSTSPAATVGASPQSSQAASPSSQPAPLSSAKAPARTAASTLALWPKRAAGVLTGIVVGIPVCAVRQPIHEEKYGINQTAGQKAKPRKSVPYAVIYAPFALVSGLIEAPFYAFNNSLVNYDKPFSKEQFSITDRQEPLNVDPIKGTSER